MKIGIIGAENSHSEAIAKAINIDKFVEGFSVDYIWGETLELAEKTAESGGITNVVKQPEDMLGKVDAVIVDHRHPLHHLPAVLSFIEAGIPTFVDKPFCFETEKGIEFLKIARKYKTPVTSFSVIPLQKSYKKFTEEIVELGELKAGSVYGPCDIESEYGGIFFYGIHQIEPVLKIYGYNVSSVKLVRNGNNAIAHLFYKNGIIIDLHLISNGCPGFSMTAVGEKGTLHKNIVFDSNIYLSGIKRFTDMFTTGKEPVKYEEILKPVQILEALAESLKNNGKTIHLEKIEI